MKKNNWKKISDIRKIYKEKLVYIDFETISVHFADEPIFENAFPYAFSAVVYNKSDIFSYVYENTESQNSFNSLKRSLINFLGISTIDDLSQYRFVGWNGKLEKMTLTALFGDKYKYTDLMPANSNFRASLGDMAAKDEPFKFDFEYSRKFVNKKIKDFFLKKKNGKLGDFDPKTNYKELNSGAVASFIGVIKCGATSITTKKWIYENFSIVLEEIDLDKMTRELREYSKKDIQDMIDISNNFERSIKRYKFLEKSLFERVTYKRVYWDNLNILNKINGFCGGYGKTRTIFDSYVQENNDNYVEKAKKLVKITPECKEYQQKVNELVISLKKKEDKKIFELKDMLIKDKIFFSDFQMIFKEYMKRIELYTKWKEIMKIKAKEKVKLIK